MLSKTLLHNIYVHRLWAKRAVSLAGAILPGVLFNPLRAAAEQIAFRARPEYQGETLPPIFHYWSERHLAPRAQRSGIASPEQFYFDEISRSPRPSDSPLRILSVGSGSCAMELALAAQLKRAGIAANLACIDFNSRLLKIAAANAVAAGLENEVGFAEVDCNRNPRFPPSDVIIINQFFHHVENLEAFVAALRHALVADGRLLTSDIIGRNGHLLWPDVEARVRQFWAQLPDEQRMDHYFGKLQADYRPMNHAAYSNEGIRAQDVVGILVDQFEFELFFTFGGSIMPFVERRIGFNFDVDRAVDRQFIDRVDMDDRDELSAGTYPPSNMVAVLRHKGKCERETFDPIRPEQYLKSIREQRAKLGGAPSVKGR